MTHKLTEQEYDQRNLLGFEGDNFMKDIFQYLIEKHKITAIVETGTFKGGTTNQLRQMVDHVYTIEVDSQYFNIAKTNIKDRSNVTMILGNSPEEIKYLDLSKDKVFFFLDAHWGNVCPLLGELDAIASKGLTPVIAIHDFFVPNHPEFGYDSINGRKFDFSFIESALYKIYGNKYSYFYNEKAQGANRGVIYIEPND